ncbi:MAG: PQQ-binding-like beta-propeller repeat protein [Alphaproteobacteria bacterium]|nr:PQQ-binding-like beta-propeller repeat protein [Alphaproteobacteria bacterium]MBV9692610.1 PQQ-binding-like beta-propeller repeat protein [Alphaproteobacteria bacterium]
MRALSAFALAATLAAAALSSGTYAKALKGDWPMLGFDAAGTRYNPYETVLNRKNVKSLKLVWQANIGDTRSAPAVVGGVVYAGSDDGHLYAMDAASGTRLWSFITDSAIHASPAVSYGLVFAASSKGSVYAVDAASGTEVWSYRTDGTGSGSATVSNGQVFFAPDSGTLYAIAARTGKLQWSTDRFAAGTGGTPAVANGLVYSFSELGYLNAYSTASGALMWSTFVHATDSAPSSPAISRGIAVVSTSNAIAGIDAVSGMRLWEQNIGSLGSIALAKGHVHIAEDTALWNLRAADGSVIGSSEDDVFINTSPAVANGVLYAGTQSKTANAFNAKDGKLLWSAPVASAVYASPTVANGMVYFAAGQLYAFALSP